MSKIINFNSCISKITSEINEIVRKIIDSDCCNEVKIAMAVSMTKKLADCLAEITEGLEYTITKVDGLPIEKVVEITRKEVA